MEPLTQCEYQVANEVAKGHTPVEIADVLQKSVWTIKAQIRDIHKKLGINNNVELTLFLLCDRAKKNFDLKEIRKHGLEIFFQSFFLLYRLLVATLICVEFGFLLVPVIPFQLELRVGGMLI